MCPGGVQWKEALHVHTLIESLIFSLVSTIAHINDVLAETCMSQSSGCVTPFKSQSGSCNDHHA